MDQVTLGKTGIRLSRLGMGTGSSSGQVQRALGREARAAAKLHADIARSIADGDEERAAKASDRLLDEIEKFTRETVSGDT